MYAKGSFKYNDVWYTKDSGLTGVDYENLQVVEDNTQQVLKLLHSAIADALDEIGETAAGFAKQRCPVYTGRLRNSITHTIDDSDMTAVIGTDVWYASYVESMEYNPNAPEPDSHDEPHDGVKLPHPYLKPAAYNHDTKYRRILESHLQNA